MGLGHLFSKSWFPGKNPYTILSQPWLFWETISLFSHSSNHKGHGTSSPFYREESRGTKKYYNMPKVTEVTKQQDLLKPNLSTPKLLTLLPQKTKCTSVSQYLGTEKSKNTQQNCKLTFNFSLRILFLCSFIISFLCKTASLWLWIACWIKKENTEVRG